jgi:signal transduction histidine kinase
MSFQNKHQPIQQTVSLDGLLGHLSSCTGLYSRETFLNLYSCIARIIRQYQLKGLIFHRVLDDPDFKTLGMALEHLPHIAMYDIQNHEIERCDSFNTQHSGMLIVLTNQLCATVFWSTANQETYNALLEGGWTFHPGDCKTIANEVSKFLDDPQEWQAIIENTSLDRRYDEKMTGFITQLVNNLESRNRELTVALNQVKDLNARIIDQERLAAIGKLCSVIAHEIRNPLGLIDLYAKLIEGQVSKLESPSIQKEPLEKNLQLIRSASSSLETILSELTSYARPLELDLETVDLRVTVMEVVEMFNPQFSEKQIQMSWHLPPEMIEVSIDARRVRQALINLVKNALEASPKETTVMVTLDRRENDERIFIKVQDQGKGVDPKTREKLFTPYFSTKGNGTGLGLAHSQKILQAHGGSVTLLASSASGSTFAIILPRQTQVQQSALQYVKGLPQA